MSKGQSIEKLVGFERLDLGRPARNELGSESYLAHDGADYGQSGSTTAMARAVAPQTSGQLDGATCRSGRGSRRGRSHGRATHQEGMEPWCRFERGHGAGRRHLHRSSQSAPPLTRPNCW